MRKFSIFFLICVFLSFISVAQSGYSNYSQQLSRIQALNKNYPQLVKTKSITNTAGGKQLWMITIGTGETESKPAIVVVGGVEGNHLLGVEMSLGFAETLLASANTDSVRNLLAKTTYYIFPNVMPDATESYFSPLVYERSGNGTETDDDRDGSINEDGYEDLDGNKKITMMRVESPVGEYKTHPDDPRVLIKADLAKGEKGIYQLFSEGIDNDKDGLFNEDPAGGVQFNKNLTYKYSPFSTGAGEFPVSENETRALLDRLYELFNVFAIVSFGSNNNLSIPVTFNSQAASQRIVSGYLEPDVKSNALVSELYNRITGLKDAPKVTPAGGDLLSWGYYHYGRHSFSTPGWWPPKTKPDTTKKEKAFTIEDPTVNFLRWSGQQNITSVFTEWKQVQHPDFPGQKVEVGGVDPFVLSNPPFHLVNDIVKKHTEFLTRLAGYQPELDIINIKTEKLGNGVSRITADILNKGALGSHTKLGERSYWVKRIALRLNTTQNQSVISGKKNQLLDTLEGYSIQRITWLVKGTGIVTLEAGSPTTGTKKINFHL